MELRFIDHPLPSMRSLPIPEGSTSLGGFGNYRPPSGFPGPALLTLRQDVATAATRWPVLGWSGSMSTGKPCARRAAEVVGPIEPTTTCSASAARTSFSIPVSAGDLEDVHDLLRRREEDGSDLAFGDRLQGSAERAGVLG